MPNQRASRPGTQLLQNFPHRLIVSIPAKDESERIRGALLALDQAAAHTSTPVLALVLANNCADDTADIARATANQLRHCFTRIVAVDLPQHFAHAGAERRTAVEQGMSGFAAIAEDIIVSTDADARLRNDALFRIDVAFAGGDDLVLAKINCIRDPWDPVPDEALAWGRSGVVWRHRVRQFVETVRKGRVAPADLHDDYGGAGIAVRVSAYNKLGGFRAIPSNEDLELVRAADLANMRVNRHSGAVVDVLARSTGRAEGGMADALARCAASAVRGLPCLVEHHAVTISRVLRNPSHAHAFAAVVTQWEHAVEAIAGLDQAIRAYGDAQ